MKKIFFSTGLLFLLLACSKDKSVEDMSASKISAAGKVDPSTGMHLVQITGSGFSPDSIMINVNNSVTWTNDDSRVHTVTSDPFSSGDIAPGGTFQFYFDNPGTYHYHCAYHGEAGVIVVAGIR